MVFLLSSKEMENSLGSKCVTRGVYFSKLCPNNMLGTKNDWNQWKKWENTCFSAIGEVFACQSSGQNVKMLNKPFYMFIVNYFSPVWRGYLAVSAIKADCVHSLAGHTPEKGAAWTTSHSWRTNNLYHYISGLTFMFFFTMILIFLWFTDFNYFDFVFSYLQYMYTYVLYITMIHIW